MWTWGFTEWDFTAWVLYLIIVACLGMGAFLLYGYNMNKFMLSWKYRWSPERDFVNLIARWYDINVKDIHKICSQLGRYEPEHWRSFWVLVLLPMAVCAILKPTNDEEYKQLISCVSLTTTFVIAYFGIRSFRIWAWTREREAWIFVMTVTLFMYCIAPYLRIPELYTPERGFLICHLAYLLDFVVSVHFPEPYRSGTTSFYLIRNGILLWTCWYRVDVFIGLIMFTWILATYVALLRYMWKYSSPEDEPDWIKIIAYLLILIALHILSFASLVHPAYMSVDLLVSFLRLIGWW